MKEKITLIDFEKNLQKIKEADSVNGKSYHSICVDGNNIKFIRNNNSEYELIAIHQLYDFYQNILDISDLKTTAAKKYISGRVQSPATAILKKIMTNIS